MFLLVIKLHLLDMYIIKKIIVMETQTKGEQKYFEKKKNYGELKLIFISWFIQN